jgi:hypothetical protein
VKFAPACLFTLLLGSSPLFAAQQATVIQDVTSTPPTVAPADRASDASLHRLLEVQQARKIVETMSQQMDVVFTNSLNQMLAGKHLNPKQQEVVDKSRIKMRDLFKDVMSWEVMEPLYMKVYADTFTQKEIDGMTAFYSSPVGHAVIQKMPLVLTNSMAEMQKRMGTLFPKVQQIAKETAEEIKAEKDADGKAG